MARRPTPTPGDKAESLTVRRLPAGTKHQLRLRAARHGRSVEDEVRDILHAIATAPPESAQQGGAARSPGGAEATARAPAMAPGAEERGTPAFRITLIIGGGIAAYKSLDLIRRLRERGGQVRCVLTHGAQQFVTPLAAGALSGTPAYTDLFDPHSEFDAGHIRLAREADLIVVAPATADLMAKMANGLANDLASAILLATRAPVLLAPAMNPAMWANPATQRNLTRLRADGIHTVGPHRGEMAERGEAGIGRMAEPLDIVGAVLRLIEAPQASLKGARILITAGPTHEPIDPVRYIANRSSGKQGYAIAAAAARAGADVTLISGPTGLPDPEGVKIIRVETASEMLSACQRALPVDIAIFAAAVADWRAAKEGMQKIKKAHGTLPQIALAENPDILAIIAQAKHHRPKLVIGFAAETENLIANAKAKLQRKGCDWIVANDVSPEGGVMGGDRNTIHIIARDTMESWPQLTKDEVAARLVETIADAWADGSNPESGTMKGRP